MNDLTLVRLVWSEVHLSTVLGRRPRGLTVCVWPFSPWGAVSMWTLTPATSEWGLCAPIAPDQLCAKSMSCKVNSQEPFGNAILSVRACKSCVPHRLLASCVNVGTPSCTIRCVYTVCNLHSCFHLCGNVFASICCPCQHAAMSAAYSSRVGWLWTPTSCQTTPCTRKSWTGRLPIKSRLCCISSCCCCVGGCYANIQSCAASGDTSGGENINRHGCCFCKSSWFCHYPDLRSPSPQQCGVHKRSGRSWLPQCCKFLDVPVASPGMFHTGDIRPTSSSRLVAP